MSTMISPRPTTAGLQRVLDGTVDAAVSIARPTRLLLIGSAARGEESYGRLHGHEELFSDLELLILLDRAPSDSVVGALREAFDQIRAESGFLNPFFHVGFGVYREPAFFARLALDRQIATYELVRNARVLHGPDFPRERYVFPVSKLDLGGTNELILRRLWMQLVATPVQLVEGDACPFEIDLLKLSLCRNILDVLTILLPNHGVLLPTYAERYGYAADHPELLAPLGAEALSVQRSSLDAKLTLDLPGDAGRLYADFLLLYLRLLAWLTGENQAPAPLSLELVRHVAERVPPRDRRLFRPSWMGRVRQLRRSARLARRSIQGGRLLQGMRLVTTPQRGAMIGCLLYLHLALHQILTECEPTALGEARRSLRRFDPSLSDHPRSATPRADWLQLYRAFCRFMGVWKYNDPDALGRWGIVEWRHSHA